MSAATQAALAYIAGGERRAAHPAGGDLLYEFAGFLSVQETLPPTRGEAYPWHALVEQFYAARAAKQPDPAVGGDFEAASPPESSDQALLRRAFHLIGAMENDAVDESEYRRVMEDLNARLFGCTNVEAGDAQASPSHDPVQKAAHYNTGRFEVIDVLEDWGLEEDALLWNAVKYIARHQHKGNPLQDLRKARYYLDRRIRMLEEVDRGDR